MNKILKTKLIFPLIIFLIIMPIILYPLVKNELGSSWVKTEFYFSVLFAVLVFALLAYYAFYNCKSKNLIQKYLGNIAIIIAIIFYYKTSLSSDPAFPTLDVLEIASIVFIAPALGLFQVIISFLKKYYNK